MKATIKQDHLGSLLLWKGDPDNTNNDTAEVYLQFEVDTKALLDEIGPDIARELRNGWTCIGIDVDDMWFPQNEQEDGTK